MIAENERLLKLIDGAYGVFIIFRISQDSETTAKITKTEARKMVKEHAKTDIIYTAQAWENQYDVVIGW